MSKFEIKKRPYNKLLEEVGVKVRLPRRSTDMYVEKVEHNEKLNRYLTYQIKYLKKLRDKGEMKKYFKKALLLMRYSTAFR